MKSINLEVDRWFSTKREHLEIFADTDSRVESWFKAELLVLLTRLIGAGMVSSFKREVKIMSPTSGKRKQVDFLIDINGTEYYCELKALCISQADGTPRNLDFYFRDDHVGLIKDFRKLDNLNISNKWVLAFIYPSPSAASWSAVVKGIPTDLSHWTPITSPPKTKEPFFISLWKG